MSKKQAPPKVPAIYAGTSAKRDETLDKCLVLDKHGQAFLFDNGSVVTIVADAIEHKFLNYDKYDDWAESHQATWLELHQRAFGEGFPRGMDFILARAFVWQKLCEMAADRTTSGAASVPRNKAGRKNIYQTRTYAVIPSDDYVARLRVPQAIACYRILVDSATPRDTGQRRVHPTTREPEPIIVHEIVESELREIITRRAEELHTRQDPWRIFQYYRPVLMREGLLKHD